MTIAASRSGRTWAARFKWPSPQRGANFVSEWCSVQGTSARLIDGGLSQTGANGLPLTLCDAASQAPSVDRLAAQVHNRQRRHHRWVVTASAAAATTAVVLAFIVVSASLPSSSPAAPASTTTTQPARDQPAYQPSCAGTVTLVSTTGDRIVIGSQPPPQMTLRVGDVLTIVADGVCASSVGATPQSDGILRSDSADGHPKRFIAVGTGTVVVVVYHAMCAAMQPDPQCRGGVADDGAAEVIVVP